MADLEDEAEEEDDDDDDGGVDEGVEGEVEDADADVDVDNDDDDGDGEDGLEEDVESEGEAFTAHPPIPLTNLKEISTLASWTVSSSKPGCGVTALRSPSTSQFWQSDGPQPHYLTVHFFKMVAIAHIRVYLDFDADESYTPTKMSFLAGTGTHDLQEVVELNLECPRGWVDVDLRGVGGRGGSGGDGRENEEDGEEVDGEGDDNGGVGGDGNVLRAFLVQVKISENHQNGKDTHVRGLQIFARDYGSGGGGAGGEGTVDGERRRRRRKIALRKKSAAGTGAGAGGGDDGEGEGDGDGAKDDLVVGLEEPDWMREPELR
ncbi:MAG: hypothetical protein M1819_006281 [Sarea resinae]|nr:MAG: hypothetical protein M1819_006281 [Sarea resinae]